MVRRVLTLLVAFALTQPFSAQAADTSNATSPDIAMSQDAVLLENMADAIVQGTAREETAEVLPHLSLADKEYIMSYLEEQSVENDVPDSFKSLLFPDDDQPEADGTRVPYYYRYLVWDTNDHEYDYVYVFRLGTSSYPRYYRHWYRPLLTCWPTSPWIYGSQWRNPYFKDGSWYFEFLFSKTRVDIMTCYGYLELEYWY